MKLENFHYELPKKLIAQEPLKQRDMSRLMILNREEQTITDKIFKDIVEYFKPGDCLVLNNTQVIPVRLLGRRKTGGKVEIFVLDPGSEKTRALIKPSKRIKEGEKIELESGIQATVLGTADLGRFVEFNASIKEVLKEGHMPLPPYMDREDVPRDKDDYQTVYASMEGATASPTAGLHFTKKTLNELRQNGIEIVYVTLHTSYGTFAPVKEEDIEDHEMHSEYFEIRKETADVINNTKKTGGRIFAVGTTSTRVLEAAAIKSGEVEPYEGETNLFIYPGYKYKIIDGIITNFHLPESTLIMLVSAFACKDFVFRAYKEAVERKYRFFSYGDAMLII